MLSTTNPTCCALAAATQMMKLRHVLVQSMEHSEVVVIEVGRTIQNSLNYVWFLDLIVGMTAFLLKD